MFRPAFGFTELDKETSLWVPIADPERLRVETVDVFSTELDDFFAGLDAGQGVVVVTEGLLNYFPTADVERLWTRSAASLAAFLTLYYLGHAALYGGLSQMPVI